MVTSGPVDDLHAEAQRLVDLVAGTGLRLRLTGGLAIARRAPSALRPPLTRVYEDVDLACAPADARAVAELLSVAGYAPDTEFNAIHGGQRLYFHDIDHGRHVDVFVGAIRMCHTIDVRDRLDLLPDTLTPSDLLLSKLQIVELNRKDTLDLLALLHDVPLHDGANDGIDGAYLGALWGSDWPLWRTSQLTLEKVSVAAQDLLDGAMGARVAERIGTLGATLASCRKTLRWKTRARLGERVRWYELPEEIEG